MSLILFINNYRPSIFDDNREISFIFLNIVGIIALFVPLYILDLESYFFVVVGFFSVLFLLSLPSIFRVLDGQKDTLLRAYEER